jgi:hypothetical protein
MGCREGAAGNAGQQVDLVEQAAVFAFGSNIGLAHTGQHSEAERRRTLAAAREATSTKALWAPPRRFTSSRRYSVFPAAERSGSFIGTARELQPAKSNAATSPSACHRRLRRSATLNGGSAERRA